MYAAATGSDEAVTYDATTLAELTRAPTGKSPDGMAYDPDTNAVFLSNEAGTTVTEIDATTGAARREIDIGGEAGNVAYDAATKHVLVDVQTRNDLAVIDPNQGRVIERHALTGCDHDHGLQLDPDRRRAFVACDGNNRLLQVDLTTFAVTANDQTGPEPDVLTLDSNLGRLYVLAESGVVTVVDTRASTAQVLARRSLADGAHSGTVNPDSHRLYVPIANLDGHPVLRVLGVSD
jgi:DNA-binding beta-propeller fold protein YncE